MSASHANSAKLSANEIQQAFGDSDWGKQFPPVLNVDQAAELAGVPKKTIYEWSSRGLLKSCAKRFGRRLRIFRDRFIRLLIDN